MDLREQLTRQSLLLDFISECVSLHSVPGLAKLVTSRLHWICDYDTSTLLLPDAQGLSLWFDDRKAGSATHDKGDNVHPGYRSVLEVSLAGGAPIVVRDDESAMFLAVLPLGTKTVTQGALCVARAATGFTQSDIRHLQHASNAIGGALTRIIAMEAEHEAEYAIKLAEAQLRAAAEDRALLAEQMVGIVSHDLRNPLAAILMGSTLMERGEAIPVQKARVLQRMQSAARRAQRLVDELLDFTQARIGSGLTLKMVDVDLNELMMSILEELRLSFADVNLLYMGSGLGSAYLDVDRIHQLFGNLVANAVMYGSPGKPVQLNCEVNAGEVVFSVRNEGEAIAPTMLRTIFEPMVRGQGHRREQHGVGLGLYIVRAIAEGHYGTVFVTSHSETGTCFAVRAPVDCRLA
jgi:signal transduction histidine kinase